METENCAPSVSATSREDDSVKGERVKTHTYLCQAKHQRYLQSENILHICNFYHRQSLDMVVPFPAAPPTPVIAREGGSGIY